MVQGKVPLSEEKLEEKKEYFIRMHEDALSGALLFLRNINAYTKKLAEEVGNEEMKKIKFLMIVAERAKINIMLAEIEREIRKFEKM